MAFIEYQHQRNGCGAPAGTPHGNCDVARCAEHGMQLIQCEEACEANVWTG